MKTIELTPVAQQSLRLLWAKQGELEREATAAEIEEDTTKNNSQLINLQMRAVSLLQRARDAAIEYNAALAKEQVALGAEINLQLLADIEENTKCILS